MVKPWHLDELSHAGPEHLDEIFVAGYDIKQAFDPSSDIEILKKYGINKESTLVDFGAGTGRFSLAASIEFRQVIAVDVSPVMLNYIRKQADTRQTRNLECVQAGFLSYEHKGPLVDVIYTRNALHHLPDFWKAIALQRMAQILKPQGILRIHDLIYDFKPADAENVFGEWFENAARDPSKGYTQEDFEEHISTEYSTYRWLFEPILASSGFKILTADFRRSIYGAYTCIKQVV